MSGFSPEDVRYLLTAVGLVAEDWDTAELAEMLNGQRSGIESVRERLARTDEPALSFDARWE